MRLTGMGLISHKLPPAEPEVGPPYHFPDALAVLGAGEINRPLPWTSLTEEQRGFQAKKMEIHAAMVDRMDKDIGRVLAQLRKMKALENTLVFFLSDNGASAEIMVRGDGHDPSAPMGSAASYLCLGPGFSTAANTPFRRHKTWVHEGGISTPLIVHWPAGIKGRGEWRRSPGHVIDLPPTIIEVAGGTWPAPWEGREVPRSPGRSLAPLFERDGVLLHDALWWLHEGNRAIRVGDWKLVSDGGDGPWELYDLRVDRGEMNDRAAEMPEKARELEHRWNQEWEAIQRLAQSD